MERFSQDLKVKVFDIDTGKLVCILNEIDAKELGVFPGDRVEITSRGKKCIAVVDVTRGAVAEDHIGLYSEVVTKLGVKGKQNVSVQATDSLKSLDFIKKKMKGEELSFDEIKFIVDDIAKERLSDVEAASFISAVYMKGLSLDETTYMTKALIAQGKTIEFSKQPIVDKHSVGGVNGRATMVIVPIVAAAGLYMPKTSSRSITSSAGTADAMEVLAPVGLSMEKVKKITDTYGGVISWGGAVDLAPADDKIIRLEHPLSLDPEGQVIASVLAKKASVGSKFVVIDLPVGKYVKIKDKETAMRMAKKFVTVGKEVGMEIEAVITNGEVPSGLAFGPALEAKYALEVLEGKRFDNLAQKSCELAGVLFELVGTTKVGKGYDLAYEMLTSGKALYKMKQIIAAQGGKINKSENVPMAPLTQEVIASEDGIVEEINIAILTKIARLCGAPANPLAGIMLNKTTGDRVNKGDVLFTLYAENKQKLSDAYVFAKGNNDVYKFRKIILSTVRFS